MATKKKSFTSPKGVAMYAFLNSPDFKYQQDGRYQCQLRLPKEAAKPMMDMVRQLANDEYGKKASSALMPWKEDGETGEIIIKTHSKYKPRFADASGSLIKENNEPKIASGSTLRLAGSVYPYDAAGRHGLSLQLSGVQILELNSGADFEFEAEDNGYFHEEAANDNTPVEEVGHNF